MIYYSNPDNPDEQPQFFNPTHDNDLNHQFINKHRCVHQRDSTMDANHICPFLKAIQENYSHTVYWFIEDRRCLESRDSQGYTALHWAVRLGRLEIVQRLIDIGYDVNANSNYVGYDRLGNTPLIFAAMRGDDLEMFRYLLDYGAQPTWGNAGGTTPLHVMAQHNHWRLAELLLDRNPSCVNLVTTSNDTPLHYAATYGHEEITHILLDYGAKIDAEDCFSNTPLDFAKKHKHVAELIRERLLHESPIIDQIDQEHVLVMANS